MYKRAYFLSPSKSPSAVIKKVPWVRQGRWTTRHLPNLNGQNTPSSLVRVPTKAFKTNFDLKFMEPTLRQIADDIWESLGPGYSESVYHCAFEVALRNRNIYYETERIIPVFYSGQNVGNVRADLIIDRKVVVELKSVAKLNETYRTQTRNYLKLLGLGAGYLINFPEKNGALEFEQITCPPPPPPPMDHIDC